MRCITLSTLSHLRQTQVLASSLKEHGYELSCLVVDAWSEEDINCNPKILKTECMSILAEDEKAQALINAYRGNKDALRWSLKSRYMIYALEQRGEEVVYLDNDMYCLGRLDVVDDYLKKHPLLLTPHHYSLSTQKDQFWLEASLKHGLFNAGFVGANVEGIKTLDWWSDACLYRCEKSLLRGLFDDQRYLDQFPIIEPRTLICPHPGINVGGWNATSRKRSINGNQLLVLGEECLLVHMNHYTLQSAFNGKDPLLQPLAEQYLDALNAHHFSKDQSDFMSTSWRDRMKLWLWHKLS
ncbi:MAG TPA: hypothetical protein DCF84_06005 [Bacteroidetes bacterium]|nr:hypothetical protein [Bacteroidota bacterium]